MATFAAILGVWFVLSVAIGIFVGCCIHFGMGDK